MADELPIQTVRVDQSQKLTARGDVVGVFRVTFNVGEHGPFTVEFERLDFTPERVKAAQEAVAATIRGL